MQRYTNIYKICKIYTKYQAAARWRPAPSRGPGPACAARGRPPPGRRLVFCVYLVYLVYIWIYVGIFVGRTTKITTPKKISKYIQIYPIIYKNIRYVGISWYVFFIFFWYFSAWLQHMVLYGPRPYIYIYIYIYIWALLINGG